MRREAATLFILVIVTFVAQCWTSAQEVSIQVFTDEGVYVVGQDRLAVSVSGENSGQGTTVDVHIALLTPTGLILEAPDWNTEFVPIFSDVFLPEGFDLPRTDLGSYQLGDISFPASSPGSYFFAAALMAPGTLESVSDISLAPFRVEAPANIQEGFITYDGLERRFTYYVPNGLPLTPAPLVFMLHGAGGDAETSVVITQGRFNELADRDKAIVVYPEGVNARWNDCYQNPGRILPDDVGFISSLIDHFSSNYDIDTNRPAVAFETLRDVQVGRDQGGRLQAEACSREARPEKRKSSQECRRRIAPNLL